MLGDEELAKAFSARLFEEGVFASAICYPMVRPEDSVVVLRRCSCPSRTETHPHIVLGCVTKVPKGTARVRVIVSATFSQEDCDLGLAAFQKVAAELQ
jgi:glycine C-acetyltransferase